MGFRGAAPMIKHFSDLSFGAVPRGPWESDGTSRIFLVEDPFKVPMTLARAMLILRLISVAELDNEKDGAGTLSKWAVLEA